jgi:parvulin-like peptidyl-prolyl isomerase
MHQVLRLLIFVLFSGLVLTACETKDEEVVINVGAESISRSEVLDILKRKYPDQTSFKDLDIAVKKDLLKPLILKKQRINSAYDMGLDESGELTARYDEYRMRVIGSRYYEIMIMDPMVSESDIEETLNKQGVELKTTHLLIGYDKSPKKVDRTLEEAQKLAEEISENIKNGANFKEMIEKYSDDPSAKKNKGNLGYFTWGRMVTPFQDAAWGLKVGEISEPVKTRFGYHLIRLDDRREIAGYVPNRTDENIYRIKQLYVKSFGDSARNMWRKNYSNIQDNYNYKLYEDVIDSVASLLREKIKNEKISTKSFSSSQRNMVFADWDADEISFGTLIDKYEKQLIPVMGRFRDRKMIKNEVNRISMNELILLDAKNYDLLKDEFVVKKLKEYLDNQLDLLVEKKRLMENINVSDAEALAYYEKHPKKFVKRKEIEIWEIFVKDEKLAKEIVNKARQGYNFENLVKKYSEDKKLKEKSGYLGYKTQNSRGSVSRKAHELGPGGKIGGPVKFRKGWCVFKTGEVHEEKVRPFEEVKQRAMSFVKNEKSHEKKKIWENELKEKYPAIIDEEKLKEI